MKQDNDTPTPNVDNSAPIDSAASKNKFIKMVVGLVIVIIVLVWVIWAFSKHTTNSTIENSAVLKPALVQITASGFEPTTLTLHRGQAVVWANIDSKKHVIASDPYPTDNTLKELNSRQPLNTNDSYSYIFTTTGTFTYHDDLNPAIHGTIIVK